jgi:hypothetical protein
MDLDKCLACGKELVPSPTIQGYWSCPDSDLPEHITLVDEVIARQTKKED